MTIGDLDIAQPWWLVLPLLSLPLLWLQDNQSALPGGWATMVQPALKQRLAAWVPVVPQRRRALLVWAIAALLSCALAGLGFGSRAGVPERALHGRMLVIDASPGVDMRAALFVARQLATRTTDTPTGVIVVAADAFDVVPLTEDPAQIDRYLRVLEPTMMPAAGRQLGRGIARALAAVERAKVPAYQIVLLTGGRAPDELPTLPNFGERLRIVTVTPPDPSWLDWAAHLGAVVSGPGSLGELDAALARAQATAIDDAAPVQQRRGLTPWFLAACVPLWLVLFFRREHG